MDMSYSNFKKNNQWVGFKENHGGRGAKFAEYLKSTISRSYLYVCMYYEYFKRICTLSVI